jgi:hypothetical protein
VHAFEAREGGAVRISLTYDAATGEGRTTARAAFGKCAGGWSKRGSRTGTELLRERLFFL